MRVFYGLYSLWSYLEKIPPQSPLLQRGAGGISKTQRVVVSSILASVLWSWTMFTGASDATAPVTEKNPPEVAVPQQTPPATEAPSPFAKGKTLHEGHCVSCHTAKNPENPTELYTREARKVSSYEGLKTQIQRCVTQLDLLWFEEEVAHVATYLNTEYYHFEPHPPK